MKNTAPQRPPTPPRRKQPTESDILRLESDSLAVGGAELKAIRSRIKQLRACHDQDAVEERFALLALIPAMSEEMLSVLTARDEVQLALAALRLNSLARQRAKASHLPLHSPANHQAEIAS